MKRIFILTMLLVAGCAPATATAGQDDPNVGLAVAQMEAARYQAQLTSTAQAFDWMQVGWTATAQSWTPTPSMTPVPTSTPSVTPTPTVDVTQTLAVAQAEAQMTKIALENQREQSTNAARAWLPYFVAVLALGLAGFFVYVGVRRIAIVPTPIHDGTGKPVPMFNVIDGVVMDADRNPNGMGVMSRKYVQSLPRISEERQAMVTATAQAVDGRSRSKVQSEALRRLLASQGVPVGKSLPAPANSNVNSTSFDGFNASFPLPGWELMESFDFSPNKPILYGGRGNEGAFIDINKNPHVAVIGPTGTGKSRYCLRPFVCSSVASGNQVIVLGDMVDFAVFQVHPNVTLVPVENLMNNEDAKRYVSSLQVILDEMMRRWQKLTEMGVSTWERAGGTNTVVVLDELGVAIELLEKNRNTRDLASWAEGILSVLVKKGRKAGINIIFSSQRAVGLQNLLSQVETFVFRVNSSSEERWAFGESGFGATNLGSGYFLSRVGGVVNTVGSFQPTDEQVGNFLLEHKVEAFEKPKWIDGVFGDAVNKIEPTAESKSLPVSDITEEEVKQIIELTRKGLSVSAIIRSIWNVTGGSKYLRLKDEVEGYQKHVLTEGV